MDRGPCGRTPLRRGCARSATGSGGSRPTANARKPSILTPTDRDIMAFAAEGDDACGVIFKVRDGKIVGRQHYYMGNVEGKAEGEILETLLQQYYLEAEDIPEREFVVQTALEGHGGDRPVARGEAGGKRGTRRPGGGGRGEAGAPDEEQREVPPGGIEDPEDETGGLHSAALCVALQKDLRLERVPREKIECFDNSNIQGSDPVASMVVFVDGKPRTGEYRKFKIQSVAGPDDFASMREIVERRSRGSLRSRGSSPTSSSSTAGRGSSRARWRSCRNWASARSP